MSSNRKGWARKITPHGRMNKISLRQKLKKPPSENYEYYAPLQLALAFVFLPWAPNLMSCGRNLLLIDALVIMAVGVGLEIVMFYGLSWQVMIDCTHFLLLIHLNLTSFSIFNEFCVKEHWTLADSLFFFNFQNNIIVKVSWSRGYVSGLWIAWFAVRVPRRH